MRSEQRLSPALLHAARPRHQRVGRPLCQSGQCAPAAGLTMTPPLPALWWVTPPRPDLRLRLPPGASLHHLRACHRRLDRAVPGELTGRRTSPFLERGAGAECEQVPRSGFFNPNIAQGDNLHGACRRGSRSRLAHRDHLHRHLHPALLRAVRAVQRTGMSFLLVCGGRVVADDRKSGERGADRVVRHIGQWLDAAATISLCL
jgi:hypothetical protein